MTTSAAWKGVERSDGAKPQLSVQAIGDRNQSNQDLTRLILSKYDNTNILAKEEYAASLAQQSAYRIEMKFRLKNQVDKRLEQVVLYASWWAIRVETQKKIYLIILSDKADDLADGLKSAKSALGSFRPTH